MTTKLITARQVKAYHLQLTTIYRDAFCTPPYNKSEAEVEEFSQSLCYHVDRKGFQIAVAIQSGGDKIAGFAYGFENTADQLFHTEVVKVVESGFETDWLLDSFRLVQIAVTPTVQGQGLGGQLHDHLLSEVPHPKALLATMAAETIAARMYRNRGWQMLLNEIYFPGVPRAYQVMGLNPIALKCK